MCKVLLCMSLVACGGARTRAEVTLTPPPATAQPTATPCKQRLEGTSICFAGGSGVSTKDAIVILGAEGAPDAVAAEYKYLEGRYGPKDAGYSVEDQSLLEDGGRWYDRLRVHLKEGRTLDVYFDVGKF